MSKRINVGHEQNLQSYVIKNPSNLKISVGRKKFQDLINVGPLIRLWGLEKNPKLINVEPTFIPDYRVPTLPT